MHRYHCVDCGKPWEGDQVSFDILQFLDISMEKILQSGAEAVNESDDGRIGGRNDDMSGRGSADWTDERHYLGLVNIHENPASDPSVSDIPDRRPVLNDLLNSTPGSIRHFHPKKSLDDKSNREVLTITLRQLLEILCGNYQRKNGRRLPVDFEAGTYTDAQGKHELDFRALEAVLGMLFRRTDENIGGNDAIVNALAGALRARFKLPYEEENDPEAQKDLNCYVARFILEPVFCEDTIYTFEYSPDISRLDSTSLRQIECPKKIRGYCPHCGSVVVDGAGRYRQRLIGLIGYMSAGKTTTIVALLEELFTDSVQKRLGFSSTGQEALCDSKYEILGQNQQLYRNGFNVIKTNATNSATIFNASVLVTGEGRDEEPVILTFIDVAGENCFDEYGKFDNRIAEITPLILGCDIYLLCVPLITDSTKDNEGKLGNVDRFKAPATMARELYDRMTARGKTPPLCILLTKADRTMQVGARTGEELFDSIKDGTEKFYGYDSRPGEFTYLYRAQIDQIKNYYAGVGVIKESVEACIRAFENNGGRCYQTLLSCSSQGGEGLKWDGRSQLDFRAAGYMTDERMRSGVDEVLSWILKTAGIIEVDAGVMENGKNAGYRFRHIPAYEESYYETEEECERSEKGFVIDPDEIRRRVGAVSSLFISMSRMDMDLYTASVSGSGRNIREKRTDAIRKVLGLPTIHRKGGWFGFGRS